MDLCFIFFYNILKISSLQYIVLGMIRSLTEDCFQKMRETVHKAEGANVINIKNKK